MELSEKSKTRLIGVNADLVEVIKLAADITNIPFIVTEGLRTKERQLMLFNAGKSQTMKSRHLTGHAVDLAVMVDGKINWEWKYYDQLSKIVKTASGMLNTPIEWGGDWKFKDGVHFQLPYGVV